VGIVDREMSAIRDAGKVKARERIAVLTALNLAYQKAEARHSPAAPIVASSAPDGAGAAGPLDVDQLIRRIDDALGSDGHLL
jgi:cell division protein ZapA